MAGPEFFGKDLLFKYSINGGEDPAGANSPPPSTTKPWLTAFIKVADVPDAVDIVLTTNLGTTNLGEKAYAISWGFNMKPSEIEIPLGEPLYLPGDFSYSCSATGPKNPCLGMGPLIGVFDDKNSSYIWNPNKVNMQNGWKGFDMEFLLPNEKANRLDDGTTLTIRVSRTGITPAAFNYQAKDDPNKLDYSAVHVGGYGYSTTLLDDSPGTPAPGPLPVLGAVAAFKASRRLRNRLKPTAAAAPRSA